MRWGVDLLDFFLTVWLVWNYNGSGVLGSITLEGLFSTSSNDLKIFIRKIENSPAHHWWTSSKLKQDATSPTYNWDWVYHQSDTVDPHPLCVDLPWVELKFERNKRKIEISRFFSSNFIVGQKKNFLFFSNFSWSFFPHSIFK